MFEPFGGERRCLNNFCKVRGCINNDDEDSDKEKQENEE